MSAGDCSNASCLSLPPVPEWPLLAGYLEAHSLPLLSAVQIEQLAHYQRLLTVANQQFNLTHLLTDQEFLTGHCLDTLLLWQLLGSLPAPPGHYLDLGSGAGIPGLLIASWSGWPATLIDRNQKRCRFLRWVSQQLKLSQLQVSNQPVESYCLAPAADQQPLLITARALAKPKAMAALLTDLVVRSATDAQIYFAQQLSVADWQQFPAPTSWQLYDSQHYSLAGSERVVTLWGLGGDAR